MFLKYRTRPVLLDRGFPSLESTRKGIFAISLALAVVIIGLTGVPPVRALSPPPDAICSVTSPSTSYDGDYKYADSYTINTGTFSPAFAGFFSQSNICHLSVVPGTTYSGIIVTVNSPEANPPDSHTDDWFLKILGWGPGLVDTNPSTSSSFNFDQFNLYVPSSACETAPVMVGRFQPGSSNPSDGDVAFILEAPPCAGVPEFPLPTFGLISALAPLAFLLGRRRR